MCFDCYGVQSLSVVLLTTCFSCVLVTDTLFKYTGQIKLLLYYCCRSSASDSLGRALARTRWKCSLNADEFRHYFNHSIHSAALIKRPMLIATSAWRPMLISFTNHQQCIHDRTSILATHVTFHPEYVLPSCNCIHVDAGPARPSFCVSCTCSFLATFTPLRYYAWPVSI